MNSESDEQQIQKDQTKGMTPLTHCVYDRLPDLVSGQSARPALTRLAMLMRANPDVAACVLRDPSSAASAHPQYTLTLNEQDQATVCAIQARSVTVTEFLRQLAEVIDGPYR